MRPEKTTYHSAKSYIVTGIGLILLTALASIPPAGPNSFRYIGPTIVFSIIIVFKNELTKLNNGLLLNLLFAIYFIPHLLSPVIAQLGFIVILYLIIAASRNSHAHPTPQITKLEAIVFVVLLYKLLSYLYFPSYQFYLLDVNYMTIPYILTFWWSLVRKHLVGIILALTAIYIFNNRASMVAIVALCVIYPLIKNLPSKTVCYAMIPMILGINIAYWVLGYHYGNMEISIKQGVLSPHRHVHDLNRLSTDRIFLNDAYFIHFDSLPMKEKIKTSLIGSGDEKYCHKIDYTPAEIKYNAGYTGQPNHNAIIHKFAIWGSLGVIPLLLILTLLLYINYSPIKAAITFSFHCYGALLYGAYDSYTLLIFACILGLPEIANWKKLLSKIPFFAAR